VNIDPNNNNNDNGMAMADEIARIKSAVECEKRQMCDTMNRLKCEHEKLTDQNNTTKKEFLSLKAQHEGMIDEYSANREKMLFLSNEHLRLQNTNRELSSRLNSQEKVIDFQKRESQELSQLKLSYECKFKQQELELEKTKTSLQQHLTTIKNNETLIRQMKNEMDSINSILTTSYEDVNVLQTKLDQTLHDNAKTLLEYEAIKNENYSSKEKDNFLCSENARLHKSNRELSIQVNSSEEMIRLQKRKIQEMSHMQHTFEYQLKQKEDELENCKALSIENEHLLKSTEELSLQIDSCEETIRLQKREMQEINRIKNTYEFNLKQKENELAICKASIDSVITECDNSCKEHIDIIKKKECEIMQMRNEMVSSMMTSKDDVNVLKARLNQAHIDNGNTIRVYGKLTDELKAKCGDKDDQLVALSLKLKMMKQNSSASRKIKMRKSTQIIRKYRKFQVRREKRLG